MVAKSRLAKAQSPKRISPDELRDLAFAMRDVGCLDLVTGDVRIILQPMAVTTALDTTSRKEQTQEEDEDDEALAYAAVAR